MAKFPMMAVALLLGVAACGGGSDGSTDGGDDARGQPAPTEATVGGSGSEGTTAPAPDAGGDDDGGGEAEGSGPSMATMTLGDQTYNFSTEGAVVAQCQTDMFGIFSVQLPIADGGDGGISIVILRDGTDPSVVDQVNAVRLSVGDENWGADEASDLFDMSDELMPGMSQVDSAEIDGSTVRGTATFVRALSVYGGGEVETQTGSFEATCGEERIS